MDTESLLYLLPSLLLPLLLLLLFIFFRQPKTTNPTPCCYPFLGNLVALLKNHHRFLDWVSDMLAQTPSNTLEARFVLNYTRGTCTSNPLNVEHLLRTNFPNYIKGNRFHSNLSDLLGDGIFNADGVIWSSQRKIASHEFNTKSLKTFIAETVQSEISHRLIPFLNKACDKGEAIDLQNILRKFAFDNICNLAFGEDPACLCDEVDNPALPFVSAFDEAVEVCSSRFLSPLPLIWKLKRFLNIGDERRAKRAISVINNYAMKIIKNREEETETRNEKQDLLSRFMNSDVGIQNLDKKRQFLRDIIISFILAGKDSTSTALTWFFWLLYANPRCEGLIYDEISKFAAKRGGKSEVFEYEDLKEMHYLHAAISESLRLFPPVPINSRLTVADDVLPDGTFVGKGWFADYCAYAMGRNERIWGKDCDKFVPERWLEEGVFVAVDQFKFPVFHGGPRVCLGKEMAYLQMKAVAAAVVYGFAVEDVVGGCRDQTPGYILSLTLKMKGGLPVRLKKRDRESW